MTAPIAIALALAVVALLFVAAPLLRGRPNRGSGRAGASPREEQGTAAGDPAAVARVELPLPALLDELELDRAMGKLSESDYERLRSDLAARHARAASPAPAVSFEEQAEALIRAARGEVATCPTCGERPEPGAQFCSACGRRLAGCAACGAPVEDPSARFCAACGAPLGE